jgi:hypothetical protein
MSFLMLIIGSIVSMITKAHISDWNLPPSWTEGCPSGYDEQCASNSSIYRVSFALSILFALQIIGTWIYARFFDILWSWKWISFAACTIGFFFAEAAVFDLNGYAWFARISGFFFLILQQVILIDFAYSWNEKWTAYATIDGEEKGKKWLWGLIIISIMLFSGSIAVIGILYWQFGGCTDNIVIITLTLLLSFLVTIIQLFFTDQGSLLTSALVCSYAVYICYSAVTINPDTACNPTLDSGYQIVSEVRKLLIEYECCLIDVC